MRYCPECGAEVEESDAFCPSCGKELRETAEKGLSKKELTEKFPSYRKVFSRGSTAGICSISGLLLLIFYYGYTEIIDALKVKFGSYEVGVATPDLGWVWVFGILLFVIGIAIEVWGYTHYMSEYEKLKKEM